jgi:hypothetical protein
MIYLLSVILVAHPLIDLIAARKFVAHPLIGGENLFDPPFSERWKYQRSIVLLPNNSVLQYSIAIQMVQLNTESLSLHGTFHAHCSTVSF